MDPESSKARYYNIVTRSAMHERSVREKYLRTGVPMFETRPCQHKLGETVNPKPSLFFTCWYPKLILHLSVTPSTVHACMLYEKCEGCVLVGGAEGEV